MLGTIRNVTFEIYLAKLSVLHEWQMVRVYDKKILHMLNLWRRRILLLGYSILVDTTGP